MNDKIHLYRMRHLFKGDDYLGKYDSTTRTVRIGIEHKALKDDIRAYFNRVEGIYLAGVLAGDEKLPQEKPLKQLPQEVIDQMSPVWGDLTPEVIAWAQANLTREEFEARYRGRVDYDTPTKSKGK